MDYNFKNLNEVERQDKPTENTTVMAFESGNPRQIPASEFGRKGLVVDLRGYTVSSQELVVVVVADMSYDPIYEAIASGQNVVFQMKIQGLDVFVQPSMSSVQPEVGFFVCVYLVATEIMIQFTNGSHHTTA